MLFGRMQVCSSGECRHALREDTGMLFGRMQACSSGEYRHAPAKDGSAADIASGNTLPSPSLHPPPRHAGIAARNRQHPQYVFLIIRLIDISSDMNYPDR